MQKSGNCEFDTEPKLFQLVLTIYVCQNLIMCPSQCSGYNAFLAQQLAPKSNLAFSGGLWYQPTFKRGWVGEADYLLSWSVSLADGRVYFQLSPEMFCLVMMVILMIIMMMMVVIVMLVAMLMMVVMLMRMSKCDDMPVDQKKVGLSSESPRHPRADTNQGFISPKSLFHPHCTDWLIAMGEKNWVRIFPKSFPDNVRGFIRTFYLDSDH